MNAYQSDDWLVLSPHSDPNDMQISGEFLKGEPVEVRP